MPFKSFVALGTHYSILLLCFQIMLRMVLYNTECGPEKVGSYGTVKRSVDGGAAGKEEQRCAGLNQAEPQISRAGDFKIGEHHINHHAG